MNEATMFCGGEYIYKYTNQALESGSIEDSEPKGHHFSLVGANPASGPAAVDLELVNKTWCEVSLYDLQGKQVQLIDAQMRNKGKHRIGFSFDLAPGTYLLALYTYHGMETIKVVLE